MTRESASRIALRRVGDGWTCGELRLSRLLAWRRASGHGWSADALHPRWLVLVVSLTVVTAACGETPSPRGDAAATTSMPSGDPAAFCEAWNTAMEVGDESAFQEVLAGAPREIAAEARVVRDAESSGVESPEAEDAAIAILEWTAANCTTGNITRRIAPPADALIDGLMLCQVLPSLPALPDDDRRGAILYGKTGSADPYGEPMLGVLWNPVDDGGHSGDGGGEEVTVRGGDGVAAPFTVFQQVIVPEMGTVLAWSEGAHAIGLYGRGWTMDRTDELVAIAEALEVTDEGVALAEAGLPDGFGEVYRGDGENLSPMWPQSSAYSLRYEYDGWVLMLNGSEMTEEEFQSFRFFTADVGPTELGDRTVLRGAAWREEGPWLVTWREPDDLVVRILGVGVPSEVVDAVAEQARELTDEEWAALVESGESCPGPSVGTSMD